MQFITQSKKNVWFCCVVLLLMVYLGSLRRCLHANSCSAVLLGIRSAGKGEVLSTRRSSGTIIFSTAIFGTTFVDFYSLLRDYLKKVFLKLDRAFSTEIIFCHGQVLWVFEYDDIIKVKASLITKQCDSHLRFYNTYKILCNS